MRFFHHQDHDHAQDQEIGEDAILQRFHFILFSH